MDRTKYTTIENLSLPGQELNEEHLALTTGGLRKRSNTLDCSMVNGQMVCQVIPD
jgi:hypothetical protein